MSKSARFLSALALASGLAPTAFGGWFATEISGNSCHATQGGTAIITRYGLYNPTAYGVEVSCPFNYPNANYTYGYIGVSAYHRNPNNAFSCTLNMTPDDGTSWVTAVASTSNYQSARQYFTRYTNAAVGSRSVWLTCWIPPAYQGNYSYLNSIYITLDGG